MAQRLRIMRRSIVIILAAAALTNCAAPVRQTVETSQPPTSTGGQMALGVVAAVRSVTTSGTQSGAMSSINAVLGALSQQPMDPPAAAEEIVIRKDDGSTAAVVEPDQTPSLAAGERVALIASSPAVIIRRN